ncbi:hypothetical protein HDK77DRAFT_113399 [Phyllosticta capitalensis]|uniref:uncharacterized protein n=1 Tax=Phyllosticta capitalensis TaxID=121624 RepID=UPI0031306C9D
MEPFSVQAPHALWGRNAVLLLFAFQLCQRLLQLTVVAVAHRNGRRSPQPPSCKDSRGQVPNVIKAFLSPHVSSRVDVIGHKHSRDTHHLDLLPSTCHCPLYVSLLGHARIASLWYNGCRWLWPNAPFSRSHLS